MERLAPGSLLVSNPEMVDPNFEGSVLLLCSHDQEGALGLTLNRPLDVPLSTLLDEEPELSGRVDAVHWGGPVGLERLHVLHDDEDPGGLSFPVAPGLGFGGDMELVRRLHLTGGRMRFFLGYSGWGENQLEGELEAGTWLILPPDPEHEWPQVWGEPSPRQWERLVGILDERFRWMQELPDDPQRN